MLNFQTLYNGFRSLSDSDYSEFKGYKDTYLASANDWTEVFQNFYFEMVMPIPGNANPNLFTSLNIFKSQLLNAMQSQSVIQILENAIQTLHLGVCQGVDMLGIYTTTPPPTPLKLIDCFNTNLTANNISQQLALKIFTWISPTFSIMKVIPPVTIKWM